MGRKTNRPKMKEKESPPEKELNTIEASNLSDIDFNDYKDTL